MISALFQEGTKTVPQKVLFMDRLGAHYFSWEFGVPLMENFIPANMVWDAIATKHD